MDTVPLLPPLIADDPDLDRRLVELCARVGEAIVAPHRRRHLPLGRGSGAHPGGGGGSVPGF